MWKEIKKYDLKASGSRCCLRLLNGKECWLIVAISSKDWRQILLENGPQMPSIGNWYKNIEKEKGWENLTRNNAKNKKRNKRKLKNKNKLVWKHTKLRKEIQDECKM